VVPEEQEAPLAARLYLNRVNLVQGSMARLPPGLPSTVGETMTTKKQASTSSSLADPVRQYLVYLQNPAGLIDRERVEQLEERLKEESDPMVKLKLYSTLEKCHTVDADRLRAEFVETAAKFAEAEQVTPDAFLRMGVPRVDLVDAGLYLDDYDWSTEAPVPSTAPPADWRPEERTSAAVGAEKQSVIGSSTAENQQRKATESVSSKGKGSARQRVSRGEIAKATGRLPESFTIKDLEVASGANPITVRKVVADLLSSGQLAEVGPDPDYQGRGRAPQRYKAL
jgi:hypothetical protein